ncbi:hypothetical protein DID75_00155 [Candidatus Marinamargulisbacteria bacterium SCGC AG-410-N11]|nr:hypothetical protein DID75_00155 [Candidatus Marinamargulisbacteria bacterium SCGC AG-410-N11]
MFTESMMCLNLRKQGKHAIVLVDDNVLLHHDTVQVDGIITCFDEAIRKRVSTFFLRRLSYIRFYSEFVDVEDFKRILNISKNMIESDLYKMDSIDLYPYINSSINRYYRSIDKFALEHRDYSDVLKMFVQNSLVSIFIAKSLFQKENPARICTSHGIYSTWGPFYQFFLNQKKMSITYSFGGFKTNGVVFCKNNIVASGIYDNNFFNQFNHQIDLDESYSFCRTYLKSRFEGKSMDLKNILKGVSKNNRNEEFIIQLNNKIDAYRHNVFAIFPNVFWDNSYIGCDILFQSNYDWFVQTIDYFVNNTNKLLIIRVHPAEYRWMKSNVGAMDIFNKLFKKQDNILFVDSSNPFSSYELFPYLNGAFVYNGTIGTELLYNDIPLFSGGLSPYHNKKICYEFKDKQEYFDLIENTQVIKEFQKENKDNLYKFVNYLLNYKIVPISFLSEHERCKVRLHLSNKTILNDQNLDYISYCLINDGNSYFQHWKTYIHEK